MAEELIIQEHLNKNYVSKEEFDVDLKSLIKVWPNPKMFSSEESVEAEIIFLLDSSGSMDDEIASGYSKRDAVIDGAINLLSKIDADDKVSVITYNHQAVIIEREIAGRKKEKIANAIQEINNHSGGTNFEKAMEAASKVANDNAHVIFLTDGISVNGDDEKALEIANELGARGISVNTMGIGDDFAFDFMRDFSKPSNGTTENIVADNKSQTEIQTSKVFDEILDAAQKAVIKDVFLTFSFPVEVRDVEVYQQVPEKRIYKSDIREQHDGSRLLEINIGNLFAQKSNNYLFRLSLDTPNKNNCLVSKMNLSYSVPSQGIDNASETRSIYLNLSDDSSDLKRNTLVEETYEDLKLLKFFEEAKDKLEQGEKVEAARKLKEMIKSADRLSDYDLKKKFQKALIKIENNGELTRKELNEIHSSSTVSSINDAAEIEVDENEQEEKESKIGGGDFGW